MTMSSKLGEVDGRFGLDDEEGVGGGEACGEVFLAGVIEGVGEGGEDDAAVGAANEVKAEFALDELERRGHG
jgi:hypothetical protein